MATAKKAAGDKKTQPATDKKTAPHKNKTEGDSGAAASDKKTQPAEQKPAQAQPPAPAPAPAKPQAPAPQRPSAQHNKPSKKEVSAEEAEIIHANRVKYYGAGYIVAKKDTNTTVFSALTWKNLGGDHAGWVQENIELPEVEALKK